MHPSRKLLWSLALAVVLAGGIAACSDQLAPAANEEAVDMEAGLQLIPSGSLLSQSGCTHNPHPYNTLEIFSQCTELYGPGLNMSASPPNGGPSVNYACTGWGTPGSPWSTWAGSTAFNEVNANSPAVGGGWRHSFTATSNSAYAVVSSVTPASYTFAVIPKHPTGPNEFVRLSCTLDGKTAYADFTVSGTQPVTLTAINSINGPNTITVGNTKTYTVTYTDNYGFTNSMNPAPAFTWTSLHPAKATVNPSTGAVTGVATGTATIRVTGPGGLTKDKNITVGVCTAIALNPNATQNLRYGGASGSTSASLTCSGVTASQEPVIWTSTPSGKVTLTPTGTYGQGVTINPNLGWGTTVVKACTPYNLCAQMTVNVSHLQITPPYPGEVANVAPGTSGVFGFQVKNIGAGPLSFTMTCMATGAVNCTTAGVSPGSLTLNTGEWWPVNVGYTVHSYSGGAGAIILGAGGQTGSQPTEATFNTGDPFDAYLSGPVEVKVGAECTWTASASGGTVPYSYAWTVNGSPVGTNSPVLEYSLGVAGLHTIDVTVSDNAGASITRSLEVDARTSWAGCLQ